MDELPPGAIVSVSWRLRRITVAYAYVSVPVADELVRADEQRIGRLDVEAMTRKALEMGQRPEVIWHREEQRVELHPVQKAPDPGERRHRG
jgi:hypothetical protein